MKVGDYVEIKPDVQDHEMPSVRRDGLIVEITGHPGAHRDPDHVLVMFSNGAFLKFHKSQIKVITKAKITH